MGFKRAAATLVIVGTALISACSLQQTRVRTIPGPTEVTTVMVPGKQALEWDVTSSYYASSKVVLSYPLCPGQALVGAPVVQESAASVAITLWATQATCVRGDLKSLTVQLPNNLGHRALSNPDLLQ